MNVTDLVSGSAAAMVVAGVAFGLCYFAALRLSIAALAGGRGRLRAAALTLGRVGAAILFLWGAATQGAVPLLAAFAGFLLARAAALRWERRAV